MWNFNMLRSCSKDIMNILEEDTKTLEQVIDIIWIINIVLCFLTPFEQFEQHVGY